MEVSRGDTPLLVKSRQLDLGVKVEYVEFSDLAVESVEKYLEVLKHVENVEKSVERVLNC